MYAIDVKNLTRKFDSLTAVDGISFQVHTGEIFGFLGPNGAGKTTTIKVLTGQLQPTSGSATIMGLDVVEDREDLAGQLGVVFEYQNLYPRLSATDNLRFCARLYGAPRSRVEEALAIVGLSDRAKERINRYSNGMKQRLLIARAILHQPKVLFLDEPTRGLDPGVARQIRSLISDLSEQGITIFLTTHYMEEADRLCSRVAILDEGKIVALDNPDQLKTQHGHETNATLEDVFLELTGRDLY
jgi:ABC-2 type transport system ATP-binding protein